MKDKKEKQSTSKTATALETKKTEPAPFYINPKTDFGFKRLFMEGLRAKVRLLDLLKTFFPEILGNATRIVLQPTELLGDIEREKRVVFDILATIDENTQSLIEMQRAEQAFFAERSIFYICRLVSKGLERGDENYELPTVIGLCITEHTLPQFADMDGFFHTVKLKKSDGENFSEKIVLGYLDLSKFAVLNPGQLKNMQFTDRQEEWGFILANIDHMEPQDLPKNDHVFRSLFEDSMHSRLTNMEKEEYKKSVLEYEDVQRAVQYAREQGEKLGYDSGFGFGYDSGVEQGIKQGIQQGIEQGIQQGIEQGIERGIEQGIERGIVQGRMDERRKLINGLLANGFDTATIARATGVDEAEIQNLIQK